MRAPPQSGPFASRIFAGIPPHGAGQTIGLYGGSFNPPHGGHRRVALMALRRLHLDAVWWLVTPGNPLKETGGLADIGERMARAAALARHPAIKVTGLEDLYRIRRTADLVGLLAHRHPRTRFVWIMGGDNLVQFHKWGRWRHIAGQIPIAVVNRPGWLAAPLTARAAQRFRARRIAECAAPGLPNRPAPAWVYLTGPRTDLSSSALRNA